MTVYYSSCSRLPCKKKRLNRIVQPLLLIVNLFFVRSVAQASADVNAVTGEAAETEIRVEAIKRVPRFGRDVRVELIRNRCASEENIVGDFVAVHDRGFAVAAVLELAHDDRGDLGSDRLV